MAPLYYAGWCDDCDRRVSTWLSPGQNTPNPTERVRCADCDGIIRATLTEPETDEERVVTDGGPPDVSVGVAVPDSSPGEPCVICGALYYSESAAVRCCMQPSGGDA